MGDVTRARLGSRSRCTITAKQQRDNCSRECPRECSCERGKFAISALFSVQVMALGSTDREVTMTAGEVLFVEKYLLALLAMASEEHKQPQRAREIPSCPRNSCVSARRRGDRSHGHPLCEKGWTCASMTSRRARHSPTPHSENVSSSRDSGELSSTSSFNKYI